MPDHATRLPSRVLWGVIAVGFGVMFLSSSVKGAYQVYFRDLADLFDMGRGQFALTGALFGLVLGLVSPVVGAICDRYGPYRSMISGAAAAALAFALLALFDSFPMFLLAYGVLAAYALAAMTFVPMGVWIDRVFSQRQKGLAYAAISNGVAIGFMLLSPLWVWFNGWLQWSVLAGWLAVTFLLAVTLPLLWARRRLPVGHASPPVSQASNASSQADSLSHHIRQPVFMVLAISFAGCGSSMAFIDLHFVPLMQERIDAGLVASAGITGFCGRDLSETLLAGDLFSPVAVSLSVLGAFELAGALAVGYLAGRGRPALLLAALYGLRTLILVSLAVNQSATSFLFFSAIFGLTYMGTVILTSLLCLQCYGAAIKGRMFGLLFTIHQLAVFTTAYLGGLARDPTGSYTATTLGVAAVCLMSVMAALALHPVLRQQQQTHTIGRAAPGSESGTGSL
ncbi:MFS transporter [uncultured Marinobacter sp.]|uniref:MFS transporter n=1 Tax=uncultured Marinobacter sp. TaxID=187379 RepID=UPI0030DC709F